MKVCVIGAGPSGLTTIKQLLDEGHSVFCFDKNDNIGGIWYRNADSGVDANQMKVFDSLILTISMKLMAYSDFLIGDRIFYTHKQYYKYLEAYADKYGLRHCIKLRSVVSEVRKNEDGSWTVIETMGMRSEAHQFDAVAVCCGPFQRPNLESVIDIDKFSGEVVHSFTYRNNAKFKGKRALIVGLAESGADIAKEVSDAASDATLSIHSYSFLLPRLNDGVTTTDMVTARFHHYEMLVRSQKLLYPMKALFGDRLWSRLIFLFFAWAYGLVGMFFQMFSKRSIGYTNVQRNPLGEPMLPLKFDIGCEFNKENCDAINEWNRRSHESQGYWSPKVIFCKNASFIPNIVTRKLAINDSGIERISEKRVFFKNKESKEFDVIVLCTGFKRDFSAFGKDLSIPNNNVRHLYKHAFHPAHQGRLAYIGFVRPFSGGIPISAEMQARYFAQLCSGKLKLPANVGNLVAREKNWEEEMVKFSPRHTEAIPSQVFFIDSMAKEIGCLMPLYKLILRPRLFFRHWFYPFNQACYRLTGPHSMYETALKNIMEDKDTPFPSWVKLFLFTLLFLPKKVHPKSVRLICPYGQKSTRNHPLRRDVPKTGGWGRVWKGFDHLRQ